MSIASVTVAYNGEKLLRRHLDALLQQSHPLDEIILVNNASTDATSRLLSECYPQVTYLDLPTNEGVGGGYTAGFDYAMNQRGHDWVWMFDQDSVPRPDALERLLEARDKLGEDAAQVAILAPLCVNENTQRRYPGLLWRNGWRRVATGGDITFVDAVISSGGLIRSDAGRDAGPPRADFFIDYVDLEYCLRLRSHGYKIAMVPGSVVDHAVGDPRVVRFGGLSWVWADHVPWREYYKARNEVFTVWTCHPHWASKWSVIRRLARHAAGILLFGKEKRACLKMLYLGIVDGRAGKLGQRPFALPAVTSPASESSHA